MSDLRKFSSVSAYATLAPAFRPSLTHCVAGFPPAKDKRAALTDALTMRLSSLGRRRSKTINSRKKVGYLRVWFGIFRFLWVLTIQTYVLRTAFVLQLKPYTASRKNVF